MSNLRLGTSKRLRFKNFELKQKVLKALALNTFLPVYIRRKLYWQFIILSSLVSFIYIRNCCVFSGRSRGIIFKYFNLSRILVKKYLKLNYLPNFSKSSW